MSQQEMENELKDVNDRLTTEIHKVAGTCNELALQLAALRKRVHQIEGDVYKDIDADDEREG